MHTISSQVTPEKTCHFFKLPAVYFSWLRSCQAKKRRLSDARGTRQEYKKDKTHLRDKKLTCVNNRQHKKSSVVNILQLLIGAV